MVATDLDPRALACARENALRLGLAERVRALECDLFREGRADLVLQSALAPGAAAHAPRPRRLRPGWPTSSRASSPGLREHLAPVGQGWLLISDLPERLELRARGALLESARSAGLALLQLRERRAEPALRALRGDPIAPERAEERIQLFRFGTNP